MREIHTKVEHDITVNDDLLLTSMVIGNVTIQSDGFLEMCGTISRNLTIEGGKCVLRGTVHGNVINNGGELLVFGIVGGPVVTQSGKTYVAPHT